ncbi:MAG: type II toxin-antitoxin system RelE/ParE family toxin, partial [Terracidiphilus sp.]
VDPVRDTQIGTHHVYIRVVLLFGMIAGFRDSDTKRLWTTGKCKRLPAQLNRQALKKLYMLNAALAVENLAVPPGNRLEKLRGDRKGGYSIRINDQYRICFVWRNGNAHEVEVTDYH